MRRWSTASLLAIPLLTLGACGDASSPRLSSSDLAKAGRLTFSVEQAAQLLAPVEELPNDGEVVRALAEFWMDYTLLALAATEPGEDGIAGLDLSSVLGPQENQSIIMRLREAVIDEEIQVSDAEIESFFEAERPGEEVRARHILLLFPTDATQAQMDSVRNLAISLRDRARAGANFASLASEWSEDPGSAQRGGDLDYFPRGMMVAPFEQAAFSLAPGETSDLVESQFGLHIIRVEDRRSPTLDEIREELRLGLQQERVAQAESIFVAGVEEAANVRVEDGAAALMRDVAEQDEQPLRGRSASRVIARFQGGTYTAGDFQKFLVSQGPGLRPQVVTAEDSDLLNFLDNLVRSELLLAEARSRGIQADQEEVQAVRESILDQYRQIAQIVGVSDIVIEAGQSREQAVNAAIQDILERVIRGQADVFPLQNLALPLREKYGHSISETAIPRVVERIDALRAAGTPDQGGDDPSEDDLS
jgi:peptidyl-prolyl cis-trans isomerase C